jgi:hypothetical protein
MFLLLLSFVCFAASLSPTQVLVHPDSAGMLQDTFLHVHMFVQIIPYSVSWFGGGSYRLQGLWLVDSLNYIGESEWKEIPQNLYFEHQLYDGYAGYSLVFGVPVPDKYKNTQTWMDYSVWVTDNSNPVNYTIVTNSLPVVPVQLPPKTDNLDISIFAAKGFTFQDTTHAHLVINVHPPVFSPALSALVNYDNTVWEDSSAPQQFEHTFDTIGGKLYSRFNLSWRINNRKISSIQYQVSCSYPGKNLTSTEIKTIVVEHF